MGNVLSFPARLAETRVTAPAVWQEESPAGNWPDAVLNRLVTDLEKDRGLDATYRALRRQLDRQGFVAEWIDNYLRVTCGVASVQYMRGDDYEKVIPHLRRIVEEGKSLQSDIQVIGNRLRAAFSRYVIGAGTPWTPTIQKRLGRRFDKRVERLDWNAIKAEIGGVVDEACGETASLVERESDALSELIAARARQKIRDWEAASGQPHEEELLLQRLSTLAARGGGLKVSTVQGLRELSKQEAGRHV